MKTLVLLAAIAATMVPPAFHTEQRTFVTPDGAKVLYGLAIPPDYDPARPRPLILSLHPGGGGMYYGHQFMRQIVLPGLSDLGAIVIAPDCPTRSWSDPASDQAVMAFVNHVLDEYRIDRQRILVTGFSLGGGGTWFLSSRHPDLFTAAIVMAGNTSEPVERLAKIPTFIIHSRADQVIPFAQADERAAALKRLGRPVKFEALDDVGHFNMGSYVPTLEQAGRWVVERWKK